MGSDPALFPYGASYSPLIFAEDQWDSDLSRMQAAGMSLIRLGDVHGSWDTIEPRQGELRLDRLARFYAAAHRRGQRILLATGLSSPPLWLVGQNSDLAILSSRGERYPLAASYHWACINHPALIAAGRSYICALVNFAVQQPNHFGWQISNEIGFPFLPDREHDRLSLYCYCPYCQAEFRRWLQARYSTLDQLSQAWTWSTTNFTYNDWAEVEAPQAAPEAWSGMTRWIDWRLFWQTAFTGFAAWQHELIRSLDADHPTSINTFNFKGYDRFGTYTGLDQWQLAGVVDHIGYDLYPGSGRKIVSRPEHTSIFLDHGRSVSRAAGTDFWLHELESGPIGGWLLGPDYNTSPIDIWRNGVEALGHDGKLLLYMPWREWDYQSLHWGALVDLDGQPTARLQAAAELGRFIQSECEFLAHAHVPQGEIALLESKPNAIFLRGIDQEEQLFDAQRGAYRAAWEAGWQVDFLSTAQLENGGADSYPLLMLPLFGLISPAAAWDLADYVHGGGTLLGFARCASLDERGWYQRRVPAAPLDEVFGIQRLEPDDQCPEMTFQGQTYPGWMNRDALLELAPQTEVLARFADGLPAVTRCAYGHGFGVYIATRADSGYLHPGGGLLCAILTLLAEQNGWLPRVRIQAEDQIGRELDPHLLEAARRSFILISNYRKTDAHALLSVRLDGRVPRSVLAGFNEKHPVDFVVTPTSLNIILDIKKEVPEAVDILWQA